VSEAAEQAYAAGEPAEVEMITASGAASQAASQVVRTALQTLSLDQAQLTALTGLGVPEGEAAAALAAADASVAPVELDVVDVDEVAQEDRKSTRLNSSHVKISYAVFCLKKK